MITSYVDDHRSYDTLGCLLAGWLAGWLAQRPQTVLFGSSRQLSQLLSIVHVCLLRRCELLYLLETVLDVVLNLSARRSIRSTWVSYLCIRI